MSSVSKKKCSSWMPLCASQTCKLSNSNHQGLALVYRVDHHYNNLGLCVNNTMCVDPILDWTLMWKKGFTCLTLDIWFYCTHFANLECTSVQGMWYLIVVISYIFHYMFYDTYPQPPSELPLQSCTLKRLNILFLCIFVIFKKACLMLNTIKIC